MSGDAFGLKSARSIDFSEKIFVGESLIETNKKYKDSVYDLLSKKLHYSGETNFSSRDSLMDAITYIPIHPITTGSKVKNR